MTHAGSAGDSQIQITLRDDAGTLLNTTAPGTPVGDKLPHTVAMTRQGSGGGGNVIVYKDGLQTGTLNWTGTDTYTNANVVDLYDDPAAAGIPFSGMIPIAACWTRVLTPDEVVFLNSNPFAFIISSEYEMPVPFLAPTLRQKHFRFRTDTGAADATPTWGAVEDTN